MVESKTAGEGQAMIEVFDRETGSSIGSITEEQLEFLMEHLVEEDNRDQDYYIDKSTIEMLAGKGIDPVLRDLLIKALGKRGSMEILWEDV